MGVWRWPHKSPLIITFMANKGWETAVPQPYYTVFFESATALMMMKWNGLTRPVSSAAIKPINKSVLEGGSLIRSFKR